MRRLAVLFAALISTSLLANPYNSYQGFQPYRSNWLPLNGGQCSLPTAPDGAAAAQTQKQTITVTWNDNSDDEDSFDLDRKVGAGSYGNLSTEAADSTSYDDPSLAVGSTYTYRVGATNSCGTTDYSETSGVLLTYRYGVPTFGSGESNVVAQWLHDESSGAIVDEVNSISLAVTGSPTYSVTQSGNYANLANCVTYGNNSNRHSTTGGGTAASPGSGDFTVEQWIATSASGASDLVPLQSTDAAFALYYIDLRPSLDLITVFFGTSAASTSCNLSVSHILYTDGVLHHFRWAHDRDGNLTIYLDGVSRDTCAISSVTGSSNWDNLSVGNYDNGNFPIQGTICETRISHNATNNSFPQVD